MEAELEKPGVLDYLLLPLRWLEQSKGWKRRGLTLLYLLIFSVAMLLGWRELHLWRLPNIREPFDEAKYGTVTVAEADNAIPLYVKAERLLKVGSVDLQKATSQKNWTGDAWANQDPAVKLWVEENRPALVPWLEATGRPEALIVEPGKMQITTSLGTIQSIRTLSRLARLEGARHRESGDMAQAWVFYRGILRSSRHVGLHGGLIQRLTGNSIANATRASISQWSESPGTTPAMLRQAIRDIETCKAMTPAVSEVIRVEYFVMKDALSHPEMWRKYGGDNFNLEANWYMHLPWAVTVRLFLLHEPERSLRVNRLITAGALAQCERPSWARPKLLNRSYLIYEIDARTPAAVASITPTALNDWMEHSAYSGLAPTFGGILPRIDSEAAIFDDMLLRMAERAYQIDHNQPAKTHGDLLGAYLKELPEGVEPNDPVGALSVPN